MFQTTNQQCNNTKCWILLPPAEHSLRSDHIPSWRAISGAFPWAFGGHSQDGIESKCVGFHHTGSQSSWYASILVPKCAWRTQEQILVMLLIVWFMRNFNFNSPCHDISGGSWKGHKFSLVAVKPWMDQPSEVMTRSSKLGTCEIQCQVWDILSTLSQICRQIWQIWDSKSPDLGATPRICWQLAPSRGELAPSRGELKTQRCHRSESLRMIERFFENVWWDPWSFLWQSNTHICMYIYIYTVFQFVYIYIYTYNYI